MEELEIDTFASAVVQPVVEVDDVQADEPTEYSVDHMEIDTFASSFVQTVDEMEEEVQWEETKEYWTETHIDQGGIDTFASSSVQTVDEMAEVEDVPEEAIEYPDENDMDDMDISFLCGRYLAVARKMEKELASLGRYEGESLAEDLFDFFPSIPGKSMAVCQKQVVDAMILLRSLEKTDLPAEMNEIFPLINVRSLQTRKLDMQLFIHGYHKQLSTLRVTAEDADESP